MKDFFNARQRFSIRKFSFGAASVLLGTVFLAQAPVAHADGTTETENTSSSTASDEDSSATSATAPTVPSTPDTTSSTGTVTVTETEASSATADTTSETPAEKTTETASTATDKSKLASQIAALEAAINKAPAGTDAAALTQAKVALAQAKSIQASTSASQAEVDAQAASLADMVTVVAEAANQAEQAETESKETAAEAAQPAEKTELEKTVSEATVTNKLATDFVEKEAPAKEVAVDLTDAVKSAVADNQAQITAAQAVLADEKATTDAYQTAMAQLKSSIEAVYVSLRKAGKEDFAVALAETTGSTDSETSEKDALTKKVNLLDTVLKNTDITKNLDSQLLTDSSTALSEAQTVLSNDSATTTELESAIKQVGGYLQAIFKEIPLTATSSDSINAAAIGTGVGVLVDTTETVTPDMNDANGAVVKKAPPMIVHGNTLQPTSVENQYTFAYMPPLYLEYIGVAPEEAKTLYIRGSRSLDVSNTDVLVEIVKQADNTVLETHTLKAGENYKSTAMTANGYGVYIGYDTTASGAQSIGKIVAYMMSYPSSWSLGSFEIPREADYTTKYMTVDGKELATYTLKAWSDQITDPSGVREFTNYKYVDSVVNSDPELNVDEIDSVSRLATMYGAKVLRRVVKPDGTVVKSFWIKDPTLNNDSTKIAPDEGSDTTGYIKLFETDEISPWSTNTNLNFFYGDATKMSNGEILMTQENAEKIKALAAQVKETNPIFNGASDNTVRIYINPEDEGKPESNDIRSIEIGFVGNFESVIPYGVVTPGKSLYVRNRTLGSGKPNNFQLVPLYNNLLFVPEVTHIYEPKVASVVVNYVDDAGNVLTGTGTFTNDASKTLAIPEKNSDGYQVLDQAEVPTKDKTAYNTADNRPDKITTADGKIYYLQGVSSTTTDATEGTLDTEGQRVITYVYQQAGSVDVTYVNEKGNTISGKATGISKDTVASTEVDVDADGNPVTNVKPGTEYDTTDLRPTTITVTNADGTETVYYYKELNTEKSHYDNGTPDGENPNDDVFNVTEKGQVRPGTTHVVYTYEQAGSVVVHYETTDGTKLEGELTFDDATTTTNVPTTGLADETNAEPGTAYDTKDHKPAKITANGTVYYLVSKAVDGKYSADGVKDGSDAETGEVEAGKTKEVTYVYEKAGNVNINYITTDGTVIKTPVKDVENGKPGDAYNAAETTTDNTGEKPATITVGDKVYKLVTEAGTTTGGDTKLTYDANGVVTATTDGGNTINNNPIGGQTGEVAAGKTTEVTYVYQEVKGDVTVKYVDDQGNELAGTATMPNGTEEAVTTDGVKVANQESLDKDYDTTTKKATRIVTADGKVYELAGDVNNDKVTATNSVKSGSDAETGKVKEDPQNVTYVYKEVKGNVTVHYVDADGNPISGTTTGIDKKTVGTSEVDENNASIGKEYNTADLRPTTITVKNSDGTETVYYYKQVQDGSAAETGKVTETPTNVTYVYEKAGNVVVKYVTTDGTKLEGDLSFDGSTTKTTVPETGLADETNAEPGKEYNTTDHKPATITTADGKTYALVAENNGVQAGSDAESGKVEAGKTKVVTYVYQEVKGSVKVEYYDEEGNKITTDKPVVTESSTGVDYDATTSEYRPETITTANGDVYYYKEVKSDSEPTSGKVTEGETVVKYVYEKAGSVTINYISTDGTVIKQPVKDVENVKPGTAYDTTESSDSKEERPTVISTGGKVYRLVQTAGKTTTGVSYDENGVATGEGHYPTTGTVAAGLDKNVTYVYQEVQFGDVEVAYINTNGEKIADTESVESGTEVGTKYTTTPKAIITVTNTDGTTTTYRLVTTEGTTTTGVTYDANGVATGEGHAPATGEVTATKQTVTYVYEAVKGNVVVNYIDENGKPISGTTTGIAKTSVSTSEPDTTGANVGTHYDTADLRPETITTAEGKVYKLLPALTKGNETGQVTEGTTTVTYVYQLQKGDVDVHYVNTDGKEIAPTVKDTDDADTGSDYDTTDHKPEKIVEDSTGDVYYYKEIKSGDKETGKVTAGTTDVTYVYEKAGNVVVNYVTTDGTVIKEQVKDETNAKPGSGYDTTDNKPATITKDGKTYQLVAKNNGLQDGSAPESGTVESGKTTEITYVYEEVKAPEVKQGNVVVENYDTKGNKLGETTEVVKPSPEGTDYTTTPADKIESNGKTYYYKEVKSDSEPTSGKVKEGTTTVKYVYEEAGNVVVNYVTTDGTVIKTPVNDETNAKPGSGYDTTDNKPTTITKDGKTYQLVAKNNGLQDGSAPESGKVEAGKTTTVTYVYEEVKTPEVKRGNVVIRYENEKGEVIQNPVNDETNVPVGTKYDTRDNKPTTITKDGKTYELVPSLTRGSETGNVEAGTTVITYVYREVVTPTPTEDKVTKFVEEGTNTVLSPEEKGNQPKKDITGYEFVKTITDESGNTIHVYRKVVTPTPTEEKVTKFVEEGTNKELSPEEKGNQPKKDITGYEFVRTETDANGNTVHIYRKVVTPTPQPTPNPQPTPQPEPTPVPQPTPNPQPKPTPTNVTPAHDAPVQPAAVVTPAQTSAPASASEKQLPNTGTENHAGLAALGLAGLLGGLGLVSRKKKED